MRLICFLGERIVSKTHTIYGKEMTDEVETLFKQDGKLVWRSEVRRKL